MVKLAVIFFVIIAPTLMGVSVITLLTLDIATSSGKAVLAAAALGAVLALPVSAGVAAMVARRGHAPASAAYS